MGKTKGMKLLTAKPKKKCCRKKTRCERCPVVIHQLNKLARHGADGKELQRSLKSIRANPGRTRHAA